MKRLYCHLVSATGGVASELAARQNAEINCLLLRIPAESVKFVTQSGDPVSGALVTRIWYEVELPGENNHEQS